MPLSAVFGPVYAVTAPAPTRHPYNAADPVWLCWWEDSDTGANGAEDVRAPTPEAAAEIFAEGSSLGGWGIQKNDRHVVEVETVCVSDMFHGPKVVYVHIEADIPAGHATPSVLRVYAVDHHDDDEDVPEYIFPATYWCALSGVCVYAVVYVFAGGRPADAAVEYVRSTLREGWEARPYARHLDGTFTVRVLGEGPAGIGAETPADVRVEWTVSLAAGSAVPCVVLAQVVGTFGPLTPVRASVM